MQRSRVRAVASAIPDGVAAILLTVGLACAVPVASLAQTPSEQTPPDSIQIIRDLRSAQAHLERTRYRHLPVSLGYGSVRCDERVGRYCYWHDSDDSWHPEPEHHDVVSERARFLALLDSAASILPGDDWIVGQRIRYLIEADSLGAALLAAQACRSERWWCLALEGYVQHTAGDYAAAQRSFDTALEAMSPALRCEWRDLSLLLRSVQKTGSQEACTHLGDRVWWLADPLYLVPGNERLTEHYSRLTLNEILAHSVTVRPSRWGNDNRELLVRYGQIVGWERSRSRATARAGGDNVIGHHRNGGLHVIPPAEYAVDPTAIRPGKWDLEPERPHSVYAPRYSAEMVWLFHDLALFRRGDSAVVVATFSLPEHQSTADSARKIDPRNLEAALALATDEANPPTIRRRTGQGALVVRVPVAPALVSVEALSRTDSLAARARYWLDVPRQVAVANGLLALSDLLVIDPPAHPPATLESAAGRARPPDPIERGSRLGLYWEIYGSTIGAGRTTFSLTVEREGKGLLRHVGEWLGLVGERKDRVEMRWQEQLMAADYIPRALTVQLTPEMQGTYQVTITARSESGREAASQRQIEIR